MIHILRYTSAVLTATWYIDGTATDVGDVTIGIVDDNGDTVLAAGTATTNNADGTYSYTAANTLTGEVAKWTVTWTDTSSGDDIVTSAEVVGGHLFTEAEARAFDGSAMSSATDYPDADILAARVRITDQFEEICGVSFIPRYRREVMAGTGGREIVLERPKVSAVISATVGTTSQTVADIDIIGPNNDVLWHTSGWWTAPTHSDPHNVTVEYEHGFPAVPADAKRAALTVLRYELVDSNVSDRALSLTNEFGNVRLATPGAFGSFTGLPYVDETLWRHLHRSFV